MKLNLKLGDIFEAPLGEMKQFIQYLGNDSVLFSANVVRAFDYEVKGEENIDLNSLVSNPIKFNTHTMIKGGVKLCGWKKLGNVAFENNYSPPMFRATNDLYSNVKRSTKWFVWTLGDDKSKSIGRLTKEFRNLDYGSLFHPVDISQWLQSGTSGFMFPD